MSDIPYINWLSMSDKAIAQQLGAFVKYHRLEQNKTQDTLSRTAGISRSTLSLMERGEAVTLASLIQVLRVLDKLQMLDVFVIQETISPLVLAKLEQEKRKRARGKKKNNSKKSDW